MWFIKEADSDEQKIANESWITPKTSKSKNRIKGEIDNKRKGVRDNKIEVKKGRKAEWWTRGWDTRERNIS